MKNISFALILLLLFSCVNVYAADSNIIKNPSMDESVKDWTARNGAKITWQKEGAAGSAGSAKVELAGGYSAIAQNVNMLKGETYTIEFYIRMDKGNSTVTVIQNFTQGGWWYLAQNVAVTEKWKKISLKYTCDGKNTAGKEVDGKGILEFRIADGQQKLIHYLDEVKVIPKGDVEPEPELPPEEYIDPLPQMKPVKKINFEDTAGHWAQQTIDVLAANGILNGVSSSAFEPEREVTRAEFINMVVSGLKIDHSKYAGVYSDVNESDWFADAVQTAYELGIINKVLTIGGKLHPNSLLTRQEAAVIAAKVSELRNAETKNSLADFTDKSDIAEWAVEAVHTAGSAGLITGFPDGSFWPENNITRAQAAEILKRIVEISTRMAIYVDPDSGSDKNDGTAQMPLKSIDAAQKMVRKYNKNMRGNLYVFLKASEHILTKPVLMTAEDSGSNGYNIIYTSYGEGKAAVSGGKTVTGWSLYDSDKNIYKANVGMGVDSRQLFVNGVRATRAKSETGLTNCTTDNGEVGHTTTDIFLADYKNVSDLEMVYYEQWTNPRCGVDSITVNDGVATIKMDQPGWKSVRNKGGTSVTKPVYYENAYELLDRQGEWYIDKTDGSLYYIPRVFEDITTAKVILPVQEKLVRLEGSIDNVMHNVSFENISFEYTTWMRPSTNMGHSDAQNNHLRDSGGGGDKLPDSAVFVRNGRYINFTECSFSKLGITGLELIGTVQECNINANEFYDISGSAVSLGEPYTNDTNIYNPTQIKYMVRNNNITNNYIHNIGVDYMSAAAISAGFPKNTNISNNEIFDVPYSGMHIGYGWDSLPTSATENLWIDDNYIHVVMNNHIFDGGGIYTIGATGGTAEKPNYIRGNYIQDVKNYHGSLYTDEGTTNWTLTQNVVDLTNTPLWYGKGENPGKSRWLHMWTKSIRNCTVFDNYSTTEEKTFNTDQVKFEEPHLFPDANWSPEAKAIIEKAGVKPEYMYLFPEKVQEVKVKDTYFVASNDEFKIDITATSRKSKAVGLSSENVYMTSRNPDIAEVTDDGNVKAIKQGKAVIDVTVLLEDLIKEFEVEIFVDDDLDKVEFNVENIRLIEGYNLELKPKAVSKFGKEMEVESVKYSSADEKVASVSETGVVEGKSKGKTTINTVIKSDGKTVEKALMVDVISYGTGEVVTDTGYNFGTKIADMEGWVMDSNGNKSKKQNGMAISTPGGGTMGFAAYSKTKFSDELLSFDMQINAESGWPSMTFRCPTAEEGYTKSDCYMITFGKGYLELQKFNGGKRTVIFGEVSGFDSVGGKRVPFNFEYGKKYKIQTGAKNEADGVRITLNIDNINIIDYLDTAENRLTNDGYVNFYVRSGNMELYPPS